MYINIHKDRRREETDGGRREGGEGGMGVGCVCMREREGGGMYIHRKDESFA